MLQEPDEAHPRFPQREVFLRWGLPAKGAAFTSGPAYRSRRRILRCC